MHLHLNFINWKVDLILSSVETYVALIHVYKTIVTAFQNTALLSTMISIILSDNINTLD